MNYVSLTVIIFSLTSDPVQVMPWTRIFYICGDKYYFLVSCIALSCSTAFLCKKVAVFLFQNSRMGPLQDLLLFLWCWDPDLMPLLSQKTSSMTSQHRMFLIYHMKVVASHYRLVILMLRAFKLLRYFQKFFGSHEYCWLRLSRLCIASSSLWVFLCY